MKFKLIVILSLIAYINIFATSKKDNNENISKSISRAEAYFVYGDYHKTIKILDTLLKDISKLNYPSLLNTYQLISRAEYYSDNLQYSEDYLKLLYLLKSDYRFDPVFINPKFIDFANKVYSKYKAEINKNKYDLSKLLRKKNPDAYGDVNTKKYFYKNFIPFGVGQFQNGHKYKGYMIIGSESLFLFTSVTSYILLKYYQKNDYTFKNEDLAYTGKAINNISFYMLAGVYLYSVIDALVYYNAANIEIIQSKNFQISPIITPDLKYVTFQWKF